jgi:hypothetical protein
MEIVLLDRKVTVMSSTTHISNKDIWTIER